MPCGCLLTYCAGLSTPSAIYSERPEFPWKADSWTRTPVSHCAAHAAPAEAEPTEPIEVMFNAFHDAETGARTREEVQTDMRLYRLFEQDPPDSFGALLTLRHLNFTSQPSREGPTFFFRPEDFQGWCALLSAKTERVELRQNLYRRLIATEPLDWREVALIKSDASTLERRLGASFVRGLDDFDRYGICVLETPQKSGFLPFMLMSYGPEIDGQGVALKMAAPSVEGLSAALEAMAIGDEELGWVLDGLDLSTLPSWALMRQDDNGNAFLISTHKVHARAQALQRQFEARGHKQLYWVEPYSPA